LAQLDNRVAQNMQRLLGQRRLGLGRLQARLAALHPRLRLARQRAAQQHSVLAMVHGLRSALHRHRVRLGAQSPSPRAMIQTLSAARARLGAATARLMALSPVAVLERGYSIVTDADGRVVRRPQDVAVGAALTVRLHQGELLAQVQEVRGPSS
jgi:exodeoxyribonuclease VII large subunit